MAKKQKILMILFLIQGILLASQIIFQHPIFVAPIVALTAAIMILGLQ